MFGNVREGFVTDGLRVIVCPASRADDGYLFAIERPNRECIYNAVVKGKCHHAPSGANNFEALEKGLVAAGRF